MNHQDCCTKDMWDSFQDNLENTINTNIPQKTARSKDGNHWITADIKWLIRKRDKHNERKKKSADTKHNSKYKELKRLVQREIRHAY